LSLNLPNGEAFHLILLLNKDFFLDNIEIILKKKKEVQDWGAMT